MRATRIACVLVVHQLFAVALGCSTVHVAAPAQTTVIARTMELGGVGGEAALNFRGFHAGAHARGMPWRVAVHRRGEVLGKLMSVVCDASTHKSWTTKLGYVSVDVAVSSPLLPRLNMSINLASDGINEAGLTVSEHTLRQSVYARADDAAPAGTTSVCFSAFTAWLLGNVASVRSLREDVLPRLRVLPFPQMRILLDLDFASRPPSFP